MQCSNDDIAVIGMAGVFPGAADVAAFWENIVGGVCAIGDHPDPERERVFDADADMFERLYSVRGGFLGDLAAFDPTAFGVMPNSVDGGNPDHFLMLRVAREALEDAGLAERDFPRERTDVVIAHGEYLNRGNANWAQHGIVLDQTVDLIRQLNPACPPEELDRIWHALRDALPRLDAQTVPSIIPNVIAGRIANRFDLGGTSYIVDAACASSLIAADQAATNLLLNRCDLALVGGVQTCILLPAMMVFCELGAMSRSDTLRPFDRKADGTLLGEAVGMIVLKRRRDAERDGDRIYALIKGFGAASDGRSKGLLAPRREGEALAIRRAYEAARVDPETVGLIEAHGTGIALGDATEIAALKSVFGPRRGRYPTCAVGSVKSMIGHSVPAAGIASLIKTALALHHRVLPPTVNCDEVNPDLGLDTSPFVINTETRPWVHGRADAPRRAGINAFGFGGINSHCVMEEAGRA
ncbi:MAG: polyketide synthase [Lentisphaerae bacterium]|nr:polyketide synthase [Lentisphaerota bacterium]